MKIFSSKSIYDQKDKEKAAALRDSRSAAERASEPEQTPAEQPSVPQPQAARPAAPTVTRPAATATATRPAATATATRPAAPQATRPTAPTATRQAAPTATRQAAPAATRQAARPAAQAQTPRPAASAQTARSSTGTQTAPPRRTVQHPAAPAVRTHAPKPTAAQPRPRTAVTQTVQGQTMAQSAANRRARTAQASRTATAAQPVQPKRAPRVQAGFVEESPARPRRERPTPAKTVRRKKRKKRKTFGQRLGRFVVVLALLFAMYLTAVFSNIPFIAKWRTIYIQTAMATMRHQWLATAFIPHSVIDKVMADVAASREAQIGVNSEWGDTEEDVDPETGERKHRNSTLTSTKGMTQAEIDFFDRFWEVDVDSLLDYVRRNPAALADGWENININHTALSDSGTTIRTVQDEQVLAINAKEDILIIRESGTGYRGIMAICKDPSRLSLQASSSIGSVGEVAGVIAEAHNGIIAMTGSGFIDEGGVGNGGTIVGYAMCNGMSYGGHLGYGYKRLELRQDNRIYVVDATDDVHPDTTDCMEFSPAMIIDGKIVVDSTSGFTDLQPRACIGQSKYGEIIMLLIEGRLPTISLGLGVPECARIMARHECWQAMNLDGGTSAMIWYDGDYIMKSSNPVLEAGRTLPNAFVYARADG